MRHWLLSALLQAGWAPAAVFLFHAYASRVLRLYENHPASDIVMHAVGGLVISFFFWRTTSLAVGAGVIGAINRTGLSVIVFGLTCAAAVFWEFGEYLSDRYLGTRAQLGLDDTLGDMLVGIVGGVAFLAATRALSTVRRDRSHGG
jgi:hypothetical protein